MSDQQRETRLIRARPLRPRFGWPWPALVLGVATAAFAVAGMSAVSAQPQSTVSIVVDGGLPLNITQQSVDASLSEPIRSWEPLTFRVTADLLTYDQLQGRDDAGIDADVVLSTALENDTGSTSPARFSGAAVRSPASDRDQALSDRFDISNTYIKNVGLGHGPLAVVASAQTAADALTHGPIGTPAFWVAGTGLGVLLTLGALSLSLRRRLRWESRYRRLVTAQRKLARVVLDLEALEVTYATTPEKSRPKAFTAAWEKLHEGTLALARREDALMEAVFTRATALKPGTGKMVASFESGARDITRVADALLGAGAVHGKLRGRSTTFDRLSAPLNDAANELLERIAAAPGGTLPTQGIERLREALGSLLAVAEPEGGSAGSRAEVRAWTLAERELALEARSLAKALRRYPHGRILPRERIIENQSELRASLGIGGDGSGGALAELDAANAAARALLGPLQAYDSPGMATVREARAKKPVKDKAQRTPDEPRRRARTLWIVGAATSLITSMIAAGIITSSVLDRPGWELTGGQQLRSLTLDGRADGIEEESIRHYLEDKFPEPLDVTLAVRDAEEYLRFQPPDPKYPRTELDPAATLEAIWRVKGEFPSLVDPLTRELHRDQAIMLVMVFDDGGVAVPATLTGAVAVGEGNRLGSWLWNAGSVYIADSLATIHLATELEDLARGLQSVGLQQQGINGALLFWLLTAVLSLSLLTVARVIHYGGSISAGLGRFGRGGAALRQAKKRLDTLALGLDDSRINAVAVLGAGSAGPGADAGQRLFERALVMGWREAADLAALRLASRLDSRYVDRVAHLERLVATLGERDANVERRTRVLLEATRGAGGGRPETLKLP